MNHFNIDNNDILVNIINIINKYKVLIGIIIFLIITCLITSVIINNDKEKDIADDIIIENNTNNEPTNEVVSSNTLTLIGEEIITIYRGTEYIEPGYEAYNIKNQDISSAVTITNNLDIEKIGEYQITYKLYNIIKTRTIKVVANPNEITTISLNKIDDSTDIYLMIGETYKEPGYEVINSAGLDLQDEVKIEGTIDNRTPGTYEITYSLVDPNENLIIEKRKVIVIDIKIALAQNIKENTNQDVTINIKVDDNYFDYILLPNNTKTKDKNYNYTVTQNGTYTFVSYNKSGYNKKATINITNIDKTPPTGECSGFYKNRTTTINIKANDNVDVDSYILNNKTYNNSEIKLSQKLTKANITIKDKVGNTKQISCNIEDNSYLAPIKPSSNESIVKQAETETLKVYITKKNSYYITRIWSYDPYYQLHKQDSPEYGVNLYTPGDNLKRAISANNLNNKLVLGFSGSGFYLKNTYDADSVSKYPAYDKTSVGSLVITNGKVVRNAYDKSYKTWYTTGIDKNNNLRIFTDSKASTTSEINAKKDWAQSVINSGIRNTFTFASPLVINGVKSDITTSMPSATSKVNRQAICQVNQNNFILITGSNLNRNDLINIMLELNCQTGTNLDGGGSIALLIKEKNSNTISTIIGNSRALTEVGYFTE